MREESRLPHSGVSQTPKFIQLFGYIQFLGKFQRYLSIPKQTKEGQYKGEWRLPQFSETEKMRKELAGYVKEIGFPKGLVGYLQSAISRYDIHLLAWVVREALNSIKRNNVLVWIAFLLRKLFK